MNRCLGCGFDFRNKIMRHGGNEKCPWIIAWNTHMNKIAHLKEESAFGTAIDAVLTNLGRIASSPSSHLERDRFVDGATYLAIAFEVGTVENENA